MKFLLIFLLVIMIVPQMVFAYPQAQLKECILGVKRNPIILGAPESSISNWCDCALQLIVDQEKDDVESAKQCGKQFFR